MVSVRGKTDASVNRVTMVETVRKVRNIKLLICTQCSLPGKGQLQPTIKLQQIII